MHKATFGFVQRFSQENITTCIVKQQMLLAVFPFPQSLRKVELGSSFRIDYSPGKNTRLFISGYIILSNFYA